MSKEVKKLKIANWIMWIILVLWLIAVVVWLYPRNTVDVADFRTDKTIYKIGDNIIVNVKTKTHFKGKSNYDVRLDCDKGRYLLTKFTVASKPSDYEPTIISVGAVPIIPTPDVCHVTVVAVHEIEVLPYVNKRYIDEWSTNSFHVEAKE